MENWTDSVDFAVTVCDAFGFTEQGGRVQFRAAGATNDVIQAAKRIVGKSEVGDWTALTTYLELSNLVLWIDRDVTNYSQRFYRVVPP